MTKHHLDGCRTEAQLCQVCQVCVRCVRCVSVLQVDTFRLFPVSKCWRGAWPRCPVSTPWSVSGWAGSAGAAAAGPSGAATSWCRRMRMASSPRSWNLKYVGLIGQYDTQLDKTRSSPCTFLQTTNMLKLWNTLWKPPVGAIKHHVLVAANTAGKCPSTLPWISAVSCLQMFKTPSHTAVSHLKVVLPSCRALKRSAFFANKTPGKC